MSTLQHYISEGEHQQQDFKFRLDDAKKIARTLVAFANTDGGRLLIGVKDNGKVTGVYPEEEFHVVQGAAELFCKPPVTFKSQVWEDEHKLVLEINVPASESKPHKAKDEQDRWKTYIRRDDHTLLANKILVGVWRQLKKPTSKPETYSEEAQKVLSIIQEDAPITLSKIYRKSKLKKNVIDKLLILFVSWNVIRMKITPEGTFYAVD